MGAKVLEISAPAGKWTREGFEKWVAGRGYEGEISEAGGRLVVKVADAAAGEKVETRKGGRGLEFKVAAAKPTDPPAGGSGVSIWDRPISEVLDLEVL